MDGTGTAVTVGNLIDAATKPEEQTPWYLLDVSRPLKPLIFQERTKPEMTAQTDARTDNVFMSDQYRYGVRYRCNAGFGFWQQAVCVRDALNQTNFLKARTLLQSFTADGGRPLGLGRGGKAGTLLVVPAALEADAIKLVDLQLINGGESNPCYNMATLGNSLALSLKSTIPGMTATAAGMSGGQQDPDIGDALAAVFGADYTLYCVPWAAETQLAALRDHLNAISGPLEQRRATAWLATTGTLAKATTLAGALNSGRISLACLPASPTPPECVSAAYCAVAASEEDPARPLNTLALTGVSVPPDVARLSRTEQEVALKSGVTPLEVGPGNVVQIVRAISTYTVNAAGVADVALLDMTTIRTLDYVAKAVRERIELRFPREKLSTRTPPKVRSEILDVLRQLEALEIVEEVAANADGVLCERDMQDANRLNARIPSDVVNGLHVFAAVIDLLL